MRLVTTHPGEILLAEYLDQLALSSRGLAHELGVAPSRVVEFVAGRQGVDADLAIRLSRYLGTTPEIWLRMQMDYDVAKCLAENDYSDVAERLEPAPPLELVAHAALDA
jgi:addiction module HigA family antidote